MYDIYIIHIIYIYIYIYQKYDIYFQQLKKSISIKETSFDLAVFFKGYLY